MGKRSPNGMPHPYRRSDGRWQTNVELPRRNGKRRRKALYGMTSAEARDAWLAYQRTSASQREMTASGAMTFEAFAQRTMLERKKTRAPSTIARDESMLRVHVFPYIGKSKLADVTHENIVTILEEAEARLGGTTQRHLHVTIKKYFEYARKRRLIPDNPAAYVDSPRATTVEATRYDEEEVQAYLDATEGEPYEAAFLLAVLTGMRLGEILGLQWSNIDFRKGEIFVRNALALGPNGKSRLGPTKTHRSVREVSFSPGVTDALSRRKVAQNRDRLRAGQEWNPEVPHVDGSIPNDLVFTTELGHPLSRTNFTRTHHGRIVKKAGVRRITFHELRHTFISLHHDGGTDVATVQWAVGHSSSELTMNLYTHPGSERRRDAANSLAARFGR